MPGWNDVKDPIRHLKQSGNRRLDHGDLGQETITGGGPYLKGVRWIELTLSTEEGADFYTGSHLMNEDFSLSIDLPNHIKSVSMKYGDIEKIQEIEGSKVTFNYLTSSEDIGFVD